jgi:hypothetical protein
MNKCAGLSRGLHNFFLNLKKQIYLFNTYIYLYVEVLGVEVVVLLVVFLKMQILHKPDVMWLGLCVYRIYLAMSGIQTNKVRGDRH